MKDLLEKISGTKTFKIGEIIEGKVVGKGRSAIYLNLEPLGTGIIYGKEYQMAKEMLKKAQEGDVIACKIVEEENEDGYVELSASKAGQDFAWGDLKEKKEKGETIKVRITGANKGGLLAKLLDISAFLPVSQLSANNYPKVEGGDSSRILKELQKFIGTEMSVQILDFSPKEGKLILSEKMKDLDKTKELIKKYKVGDVIEGEITGIASFGAFIKFDDNIEGLIHISELAWQVINDPSEVVKEGQKVQAKIVETTEDKIFLSLKALKENPWQGVADLYKKGDVVRGKVTKINPFGAFVQILEDKDSGGDKIQGLCHVSEFETVKKMTEVLKVNDEHDFIVASIDPDEHRMILRLKQ